MPPVKVLIVGDQAFKSQSLKAALQINKSVKVVGVAKKGEEALSLLEKDWPDLVLLGTNGLSNEDIEITRRLKSRQPSISIILFLDKADDDLIIEAARAGAAGFLLKGAPLQDIAEILQTTLNGGVVLDAPLLRRAIAGLEPKKQPPATLAARLAQLSRRERQIARLMVEGKANREIGDALGITEETVRRHVQNTILKLQASDRTQAIILAIRAGITL